MPEVDEFVSVRPLRSGGTAIAVDERKFFEATGNYVPRVFRNPIVVLPLSDAARAVNYEAPKDQTRLLETREIKGPSHQRAVAVLWNQVNHELRSLLDTRSLKFLDAIGETSVSSLNSIYTEQFLQLTEVSPLLAQALFGGNVLKHGFSPNLLNQPLADVAKVVINDELSRGIRLPQRPEQPWLRLRSKPIHDVSGSVMAWLKCAPAMPFRSNRFQLETFVLTALALQTANIDRVRAVPANIWPLIYSSVHVGTDHALSILNSPKGAQQAISTYFPVARRAQYPSEHEVTKAVLKQIDDYLSAFPEERFTRENELRSIVKLAAKSRHWHQNLELENTRRTEEAKIRLSMLEDATFPHFQMRRQPTFSWQGHQYKMTPMLTVADLRKESREMNNCVGQSYVTKCADGHSFIFSVQSTTGPIRATIELSAGFGLRELEGPATNRYLPREFGLQAIGAIRGSSFGNIVPLTMGDSEISNSGIDLSLTD